MILRITFLLAAALAPALAVHVARAADKPTTSAPGAAARDAGAASAPKPIAPPKAQSWQQPCEADIQKLCKGVAGGAVPECLAKNEKGLSESCTAAFLWRYKVTQTCKDDIDKLCKEKLAAHATTLGQCFKENEANLSPACKAALVKGSKQQKADDKGPAKATADKPARHGKKR